MADAGSIGTYYTLGQYAAGSAPPTGGAVPTYQALNHSRRLPIWVGATLISSVAGVISGTVKEDGVALPHAWVALYYRVNGQLAARQRASATGTFEFTDLEAGLDDYYVVALNDTFNALVYDLVEAV